MREGVDQSGVAVLAVLHVVAGEVDYQVGDGRHIRDRRLACLDFEGDAEEAAVEGETMWIALVIQRE